ncbi:MAG: hypothetical protein KDE31_18285, partial [Caldilineaceae bacterium]|nr:hypothetical protein [Caldilineaceae bacterium]
MNSPTWMGYIYDDMLDDGYLDDASFDYEIQRGESDISLDLNETNWAIPADREPETDDDAVPNGVRFYKQFTPSYSYEFTNSGINQPLEDLNLAEGFAMREQVCWLLLAVPTCWWDTYKDTFHTDLSNSFAFDILPATLDELVDLTAASTYGYRLAWDDQFPTLDDADNDGLLSKAAGGVDPNDSTPDTDSDGLSDYYEYYNGLDPEAADADCDGLIDYWEVFYLTDPDKADSDGDGLLDSEEFFHPNWRYPYENSEHTDTSAPSCAPDNASYSGGWTITYMYEDDKPLSTLVNADALLIDGDDDEITDYYEYVYGYHPALASELSVLSLNSTIETASGSDTYAAPGSTINYTAVISNELDSRWAYGLLQVEQPVDTVQSTQVLELPPAGTTTLSGDITVADIGSSYATSMTLRAG